MSNVVYLHGQPAPVVRFLRVTEHRRLEQLLAAGRLPYDRFVIEAGCFKDQAELIKLLREQGHELILDSNVAELSAVGRFSGHAKHAPWANSEGVLTEALLRAGSNKGVIGGIARFAVAGGFSRVHAPTHFISGPLDDWFKIDVENCIALRRALDAEGGKSIPIDFPVMIPNAILNDISQRRDLISKLASLPIDSIWTRISGFGADATPAGLRKYIGAVQDFHVLGKPIIADGVGGLCALAIVAFGAACGLSYGVASKERFDASGWHKPPKPGGGGGRGSYTVLMPGIDRLLQKEDAEAIISASGGRRLASCSDRWCCPQGFEDTIKDPKGHFLRQRAFRCDALSAVPEPVRARHFLDRDVAESERRAKQIAKLKLTDEKLLGRLAENASRLDRMQMALGDLEKTNGSATRSPSFPMIVRTGDAKKDRR